MKTDSPQPQSGPDERVRRVCRYTGLAKPECHCQACLRELVARFAPQGHA